MNTTLFPQPYPSVPCETYACLDRAKWFVGREDGPLSVTFKLCDDCARHLLSHVPESLIESALNQVVPEPKIEVIEEAPVIVEIEPEPEPEPEREIITEHTAEPQPDPTMIYRCLDCNAEFADNRGLSNHKRIKHKE